jgi:hypothetical protein
MVYNSSPVYTDWSWFESETALTFLPVFTLSPTIFLNYKSNLRMTHQYFSQLNGAIGLF